jgi:hypothetical protein
MPFQCTSISGNAIERFHSFSCNRTKLKEIRDGSFAGDVLCLPWLCLGFDKSRDHVGLNALFHYSACKDLWIYQCGGIVYQLTGNEGSNINWSRPLIAIFRYEVRIGSQHLYFNLVFTEIVMGNKIWDIIYSRLTLNELLKPNLLLTIKFYFNVLGSEHLCFNLVFTEIVMDNKIWNLIFKINVRWAT